MNLENNNQLENNRQNRQLKAYNALECASAIVYFNSNFVDNFNPASHRSHASAQKSSAPRMERENSGFSM